MKWISSAGGPLVFLPSSIRSKWRGIERQAGDRQSDYDAACSPHGYVGAISRYGESILILNDEPMRTCVVRGQNNRIQFVRWVFAPSEDVMDQELKRLDLTGAVELELMPSLMLSEQQYWLIDAGDRGSQPRQREIVELQPGKYDVRVVEHTPRKDTQLIICELVER
jgi:hypothetical protein